MPTPTVVRVKYLERNAEDEDSSSSSERPTKEAMINIDCSIGLIVDYIRKIASLEGEIDLCEETSNRMKKVNSFPAWTRGTDIFVPGCIYFIIKVDRDSEGRISQVLPIVTARSDKIAADIMSRIHGPARHRSTSVTGKISQDKIGGKNNHQDKRTKASKPASRASRVTEG